jgi:RNA polymerase sigma factor (sigma-70 family)
MPRRLMSDGRLVRLAARADEAAFAAIFERYHQELYRYCRAILRDPDEAQDALQSTMASALRSLPGDEREIALRPWLYRVAHNEAITIVRQRARATEPDGLGGLAVPGTDLEVEERERLRALVADLDQLPERQRGALVMRELSGLSYAEIGAALGASAAAARQATYEARVALRELGQGREMECEVARRALSEHDGRVLRGRRLRAHLRACEACNGFKAAIAQRRADLGALCPPLSPLAASGLLSAILGGGGHGGVGAATGAAGGGAVGVASGTTAAGSITAKGASLAAAVVLGAGAAGMSGAVKLPLVGERGGGQEIAKPAAANPNRPAHMASSAAGYRHRGSPMRPSDSRPRGATPGTQPATGRSGGRDAGSGEGHGHRASGTGQAGSGSSTGAAGLPATSNGNPPAHSSAGGNPNTGGASSGSHGKPASPPGLANAASNAPTLPEQAQGKPGTPPGHSGTSPGQGASAPGHTRSESNGASSGAHGSSKVHGSSGASRK